MPARLARLLIRLYQITLSGLIGRHCRHFPSCSEFTDQAIARHGLWAGGWMGAARICRCNPWGTEGLDIVPDVVPAGACWYRPWRYGRWASVEPLPCERRGNGVMVCEEVVSAPLDGQDPENRARASK
jgi:putative membrane protein insertion efficiency factor